MFKKRNNLLKFKKGQVSLAVIGVALGVIILIAMYVYTKTSSDQLSTTSGKVNTTLSNETAKL